MSRSLPFPPLSLLLPVLLLLGAAAAVPAQAQVNVREAGLSVLNDGDRVDPGGTISLNAGVTAGSAEDPNDEGAPPYEVAFYLSEDAYLTKDDIELCRRTSGGLPNDEGEAFDCTASLPAGLDEGAYWIVFSVDDPDVVEEPFEPNFDETDNIVSENFTVSSATGGPDLDTAGTQLEDEEAEPGDRVSIEYIVQNEGNADSGDFEVGYYFQPSRFFYFTPSEAVLAERETLGGVEAGEEEDESEQVTVPQDLPPGLYTVYVVLDDFGQIPEEDETNNITGSGGLTILPTPGGTLPDLTVEGSWAGISPFYADPTVAPAVGPAPDTVAIAYQLANRGDAAVDASSVEVGYYLSADSTFSEEEDVRFGTTVLGVDDLPFDPEVPEEPGAEASIRVQKQLPAASELPSGYGDYFVLIVADPDDQIAESGEDNNTGQPQPRAILRSAEVAAGETGTFSPPGADIGVSAEVTQNGDASGGGHLLFRRLEGTAPQSTFDGSTAQAPDGTTLTPDHAAPVRWAITGSMLTETSFRPRLDTMGVPGIEDPDRLLVIGRKKPAEAWEPFDTGRTGSTLTGSERDPVWLVPSSVFTIGAEDVLPVELARFTARADGEQSAVLEWQTTSETNNDGFRIERRRPNPDEGATGRSPTEWKEIAFIQSKAEGGTSSEPIRYTHRAEDLDYGQHAFRLVQRDIGGGEIPVGSEQTVEIGLSGAYELSEASPNPIRERASFELTVREAQRVTVSVYDALGRRVRVLHEGELPGQETERLTLEAGGLASGVYFVRVIGEAFAATRRAVVVR